MEVWADSFGRNYAYTPFEVSLIADVDLDFSADATLAVAEATGALGSVPALPLGGLASVLYRSESSASSLIEGLGPGPRRILEAEMATDSEINDETALRVVANLGALRDAMETPVPAATGDILRWHRLLMEADRRLAPESIGAFRTVQNWIGGDVSGPRTAVFVPPKPEDVPGLIDDLIVFSARTDMTPVAHAAIAHAQFEVIHPFVDGNGRVGRMLLQQLLRRRLELPSPVPVSVVWSRDTDRYVAGLGAYQDGDVNGWLEFFSATIIESVRWMTGLSGRLFAVIAEFHGRIETRGASVAFRVIEDLVHHPLVDTPSVAERYGVTPQSAHGALVRLEEAGVVEQRSFSRRRKGRPRRVFAATELIDLLG